MSTQARPEPCLQAERCMQAYVDRALSVEEVLTVEEHLAVCPTCAQCYSFEAGMRTVVRQACDEPCPDSLRAQLTKICADCDCE